MTVIEVNTIDEVNKVNTVGNNSSKESDPLIRILEEHRKEIHLLKKEVKDLKESIKEIREILAKEAWDKSIKENYGYTIKKKRTI